MKSVIYFLLLASSMLVAVSCGRAGGAAESDVCSDINASNVCPVPFEAVYSERKVLIGRDLRMDGVLVVGIRPEPPGTRVPVMLLFPSIERARICNPDFAIEIIPQSKSVAGELENANGRLVSISGRFGVSANGNWGKVDIADSPALISSERTEFSCMAAIPPPLSEP